MLSDDVYKLGNSSIAQLIDNYQADNRPWVIAFSGGKDSTLVLQLVYEMLLKLKKKATKQVYLLSSDTQVEPPPIEQHLNETLQKVREHASSNQIPVTCQLVRPAIEDSFWAKLIGKGYPPPTRNFRWCTSKMKIKPARLSIERIAKKHGSVVLLLGSRLGESNSRKRRMEGRDVNSRGLNPHHEIPNAFVLTPIANWETEEVWEYLIHGPKPPWGGDHSRLAELYRDASGGECPLVLDLTTPSCGGSRFGCWTCTVVKQDKSLQGFIDSGETSLQPYADYCNWLRAIREDESRRLKRRRDNTLGLGPFNRATRIEMLEKLLELEQTTERQLVSVEIIEYIQTIWTDEFDLENTAVAIAERFGRRTNISGGKVSLSKNQQSLLKTVAKDESIDLSLLERLLMLTEEFPDLTQWGAKKNMQREIKRITEAAASEHNTGVVK